MFLGVSHWGFGLEAVIRPEVVCVSSSAPFRFCRIHNLGYARIEGLTMSVSLPMQVNNLGWVSHMAGVNNTTSSIFQLL